MGKIEDVAVIGAGPAGLAAALQLVREGFSPLVLEKDKPGGLLSNANLVENYPGFPGGIRGLELADLFLRQAESGGVKFTSGQVKQLTAADKNFLLETGEEQILSRKVIIATGTRANQLEPDKIHPDARELVFTEVVKLIGKKEQEFAVLGAGDAALDYALNLAGSNHAHLLTRSDRIRGLGLLYDRVRQHKNIRVHHFCNLVKVNPGKSGGLQLDILKRGDLDHLACDYLVTAIGRTPVLDFVAPDLLQEIRSGNHKGRVYLIGDVINGRFRQTAMAVGDGIKSAMDISHQRDTLWALRD